MSSSSARDKTNSSLVTQNSIRGGDDDDRWVDSVVSCAQAVNKMFVRNTCRLCQVYTDRQVEFEVSRENNPVERAFLKAAATFQPEVELYRQFLFDEDSVVGGLRDYDDGDDDEEPSQSVEEEARSIQTQLTH